MNKKSGYLATNQTNQNALSTDQLRYYDAIYKRWLSFMTDAVRWHDIFDKSTYVVAVLCPCFTFRIADSLKPVLIEHQ